MGKCSNSSKKKMPADKPSLMQPMKGMRPDLRLMIRLGEESPHRSQHPFLLQKQANSVLPSNVVLVGKVAHSKAGIALIAAAGTVAQQPSWRTTKRG